MDYKNTYKQLHKFIKDEGDKMIAWPERQKDPFWNERIIADVFEKVGLSKIVRELHNDELTSAIQSAMIKLVKI